RHGVPFTNTTDKSVEELAVHILQAFKLKRRF
ncbi:phosphoenolpyruvate synthase regulatory protein, partial [Neisseria sp. P0016.S009]